MINISFKKMLRLIYGTSLPNFYLPASSLSTTTKKKKRKTERKEKEEKKGKKRKGRKEKEKTVFPLMLKLQL